MCKKYNCFNIIIAIVILIFIYLYIHFGYDLNDIKNKNNDINNLVANILTFSSALFIIYQLNLNKRATEGEYGIKLIQEFFNNEKFKEITDFLECDSTKEQQEKEIILKKIIEGNYNNSEEENEYKIEFKENDISAFLNFLNLFAKLIDNKLLEKKFVFDLLNYQINLIRRSTELNNYALKYNFKFLYKVFDIPTNKFFVYGVLRNKKTFKKELNLKKEKLLYKKYNIYKDYKLFKIKTDKNEIYNALTFEENIELKIEGNIVELKSNFYKKIPLYEFKDYIKKLDKFEEVDKLLYNRYIIKINKENNKDNEYNAEFAWVYLGNEKYKLNENKEFKKNNSKQPVI
jgi:gamma-glutamylcyclotransferase (GGCT)/AIG2-like uncharacterized protein YtfP